MPQHVLDALEASSITDVHVLGRRGPAQASWTMKELRELGHLADVGITVDSPAELLTTDGLERAAARNMEVLQEFAGRQPTDDPHRIHLHFCARPVALTGTERVEAVEVERTSVDADGTATGTGETWTLPAQLVVRSVGYRGVPLPGVPFDDRRHVVPNVDGRVVDGDDVVRGLYVAGWIKRGPSGIIGTNKKDAGATVAALLADAEAGVLQPAVEQDRHAWDALLESRGVTVIDHAGWRGVDAAERALGETRGRVRTTIHDRADLIAAAGHPAG
jgi:ferredoxin--NADP+ reductase